MSQYFFTINVFSNFSEFCFAVYHEKNSERVSNVLHIISDFKCVPVIGFHLCHRSVCVISALQGLPRSTVSAVIVKWKHLRTKMEESGFPRRNAA